MTKLRTGSRRQFLASSSGVIASTLLAGAVPVRAFASMPPSSDCNALVLYRANESHAREFAGEFARAGCMIRELSDDPVRQWRDGLSTLVTHHQFRLLGLGNWADFSIARGLAAETRRFPLMLMQHDKYQPADTEWAVHHAQALLMEEFWNNSGRLALFTQNLNRKSAINTGQPSLFSWII